MRLPRNDSTRVVFVFKLKYQQPNRLTFGIAYMNKRIFFINLIFALLLNLFIAIASVAQTRRAPDASRFFPPRDLMRIGVYYYPEHWSPEQWERDFANIEKMGFEFVHIGEFAWTFLEPEENRFEFAWLDRAIELAARHNLRVVLCTPTPTPPAWMFEKYPNAYLVGGDGRRREHGSRGNNALADKDYLRLSERIIMELGERYGRNRAIWGWQLDNEPNAQPDYSDSAQSAFRDWLRTKYQTIDNLNREWGAAFWSLRYNDFNQIRLPNPALLYNPSPHAMLDFKRFTADTTGAFLNRQYQVLRRFVSPTQWITTNYIVNTGSSDPRRSTDLDFASFTLYPVSGGSNLGEDGFRLGWQDGMAFGNSFYKNIKGATGVMELQPGQVNWANVNPQPMPGAIRMWLWHAFAGGSSFACTYRYRQPLYGGELYHYGIVGTDGVTPSPGGLEFARVIGEMRELRKQYDANAKPSAPFTARRTAMLWNHDNLWNIEAQKQNGNWDTWGHTFRFMEAAASTGAPVDFIAESQDFNRYPVLIAPAYQLLDEQLVNKWKSYVAQGGNLILTARTGQKKRNGQLWEARWAEPIYNLIGAEVSFFDTLPDSARGEVEMNAKKYQWNIWGDVLKPQANTETLARYANQFYAGQAAVTHRKLGTGTVTYIGVHTKDGQLEKQIVREVYQRARIPIADYPPGVYVNQRDGFTVAVNYSSDTANIPPPNNAKILIGGLPLKPGNVVVWR